MVERHRSGRAYAYAPVLDQAGIAAAQMRALLDHGADRASVLALFVDGLSGEDERVLTELIRRAERPDGAQLMRVDVYLPLALSAVFGLSGPWVARRLPGARAPGCSPSVR